MNNLTAPQIAQALAGIAIIERLAPDSEKDPAGSFKSYDRFLLVVESLERLLVLNEEQFLYWLEDQTGLNHGSHYYQYALWMDEIYSSQIDPELGYAENVAPHGQSLILQAKATVLQVAEYVSLIHGMRTSKSRNNKEALSN